MVGVFITNQSPHTHSVSARVTLTDTVDLGMACHCRLTQCATVAGGLLVREALDVWCRRCVGKLSAFCTLLL